MQNSLVSPNGNIKAVLFDFGGVLAEEGFREGLKAIGRANGLDPETFFEAAGEAAYEIGYVTGRTDEHAYWEAVRKRTGIRGSDAELRQELLERFVVRPWMIELVRRVRNRVRDVSILSDQSNWLDELNEKYDFFQEFDEIFNSYHLGKGKRDPSLFSDIARSLHVQPSEVVFVDDNEGHIQRAGSRGLQGILFVDRAGLIAELERFGLLE